MTSSGPRLPDRAPAAPSSGRRARRPGAAWVVALAVLALVGPACSRGEFEDRTAKVTVGGRTTTYQLDSCGLDEATLFVVGRAPDGSVLQAVVGLEDDGATGIPAATGLSVSLDDVDLAAFGAESWARREGEGSPPGEISGAGLRGSRIQVAGGLEPVDAEGAPTGSGSRVDVTLDARCDDQEG